MDKELEMKKFIVAKVRTAYINIKEINKIRKFLTEDEIKMLICSNVLSHLDYGNSILVNLPKTTVKPLQSILNYAAKIICKNRNMTVPLSAYTSFTGYLYNVGASTNL